VGFHRQGEEIRLETSRKFASKGRLPIRSLAVNESFIFICDKDGGAGLSERDTHVYLKILAHYGLCVHRGSLYMSGPEQQIRVRRLDDWESEKIIPLPWPSRASWLSAYENELFFVTQNFSVSVVNIVSVIFIASYEAK